MSAVTAATTRNLGVLGNVRVVQFIISSVSTGDTFATGLKNILGFIAVMSSSTITTQASAGINGSFSGSTITLKPGEDAHEVTLYVFTRT